MSRVLADYARIGRARRDAWGRLVPVVQRVLVVLLVTGVLVLATAHTIRHITLRHENARLETTNAELRERLCGALIRGRLHACP